MTVLRTLIADDEPIARDFLQNILSQIDFIEIIGQSSNGQQALDFIVAHEPDLVFLDIHMPMISGIQVASMISENSNTSIVFVTAYDRYAISAFESNAVDYVLKPIDRNRIEKAVTKVLERRKPLDAYVDLRKKVIAVFEALGLGGGLVEPIEEASLTLGQAERPPGAWPTISVRESGLKIEVVQDDILWVEAAGDFCCIHTQSKTLIKRSALSKMVKSLNPAIFQRIHRSIIVNIEQVGRISQIGRGKYEVVLKNEKRLQVSKNYHDVLRGILQT